MFADRWFSIGLTVSAVAAIFCFTPVAVLALSAIGAGAYSVWLDPSVISLLLVVVGVLVSTTILSRRTRT